MNGEKELKFMLRIAIIGAESSGKSTVAKSLSLAINGHYIEEYSREYLMSLKDPSKYNLDDLINIAIKQFSNNSKETESNRPIVCDTEMLTLKIWALDKFNSCPAKISELLDNQKFDLYILCKPDIPWEYEPLREDENRRGIIYNKYLQNCLEMNLNFIEVSGTNAERIRFITNCLKE